MSGSRKKVKVKTRRRKPKIKLNSQPQDYTITPTGTYVDEKHDIAISRDGIVFGGGGGAGGAGEGEGEGAGSGLKLSDLDVVSELGVGGCGIVYKVMDKRDANVYAMKVVKLQVAEGVRKQIMMELRTLDKCRDAPAVVDFVAAFFADGDIRIVMEHMDRGSLLDVYRAVGPLPEAFAGAVAVAAVDALRYLHAMGIMHRDIKPANILVNSAGAIKLCDLGVSGTLNRSLAGTYVGTETYMAPERLNTDGEKYTVKADVFSLGLTLTELVLGRYPYPLAPYGEFPPPQNLTLWEVIRFIVDGPTPIESLTSVDTPFSPVFLEFLELTLAKKAAERGSLQQLVDEPFIVQSRAAAFDVAQFLDDTDGRGPTPASSSVVSPDPSAAPSSELSSLANIVP